MISLGFLAWRDSPVLGNGLNSIEAAQRYMSALHSGSLRSINSLFDTLMRDGITLLALYVIACADLLAQPLRARAFGALYIAMWLFAVVIFIPLSSRVLSLGIAFLMSGCFGIGPSMKNGVKTTPTHGAAGSAVR